MIIKAQPIEALCEHEGILPENYQPDCWNDVDETEYACNLKKRILLFNMICGLSMTHSHPSKITK